jgi:hypothetical protein
MPELMLKCTVNNYNNSIITKEYKRLNKQEAENKVRYKAKGLDLNFTMIMMLKMSKMYRKDLIKYLINLVNLVCE